MGSNKQEKWLKELKNSVQNYSEQLPDDFWEGIQKDIPAPQPRRGVLGRLVWITSAAAVLLLAVLLIWPQPQESAGVAVADVEEPAVEEPVVMMVSESIGESGEKAVLEEVVVEMENVVKIPQENEVKEQVAETVEEKAVEEGVAVAREIVEKSYREEKRVEDREEVKKREREEYLKEMEYLKKDLGKGGKQKTTLAFVAGTGAVPVNFGRVYDMAGPIQDVNSGASNNKPSVNQPVEVENIAGFLNVGVLPAENITWIGQNGPSAFVNNSLQSVSYLGYDHNEPVRIGVLFAREVGRGLFVESGISYQYLKSKMGGEWDLHVQKLHYLGIPARLRLNVVNTGVFSAYISGGYLLEKCIYGVVESKYGNDFRVHLRKWQNSINANVGAQLSIAGGAAIYIEPGVYKYLGMNGTELTRQGGYILKSIYTEESFGFSLQGGVRFSF